MFDEIAPGIQLVGRFGTDQVGIWLLHNQDESMILGMPPIADNDPCKEPWKKIADYIAGQGWHLKFISVTHDQPDHFKTYPQFSAKFPEAPIIVSRYFSQKGDLKRFITSENLAVGMTPETSGRKQERPGPLF